MRLLDTDITRIVQDVWSAMLGLDVEPARLLEPATSSEIDTDAHMTGSVTITGASDCVVALQLQRRPARTFAAAMFGLEPDDVGDDEVVDALGELTNMVGGSIKSLLPEPSWLSLPAVSNGQAIQLRVPGAEDTHAVALHSAGERILLRVWSRIADGAPGEAEAVS